MVERGPAEGNGRGVLKVDVIEEGASVVTGGASSGENSLEKRHGRMSRQPRKRGNDAI